MAPPTPGSPAPKRWECTVCGYVHDGAAPPEECPVCRVGPELFVPLQEAAAVEPAAGEPGRTVSDVLVETMVAWGVTHVFGMVGHSNLGLADAIRRQEEAGRMLLVGVRHEGAGAFAASAYAKLSGRPAACLTIAGPGATNLMTGLWDARMDRVPVLALTGQIDTQVLGPGAFQEVDLARALSPVAAWSQTVLPTSRHAELVNLALKHAVLRRDVVHLVVPNEVQTLPAPPDRTPVGPAGRVAAQAISPPAEAVEQAVAALAGARRPAIIVGKGAWDAMDAVVALAERLGCPVATTFKAKGALPDSHPLACGVLGRSGTPVSGQAMREADLLVVLGATFAAHTGIRIDVPTVQVDRDPLALGKSHPVTVPVWGEIGVTVERLLASLPASRSWDDQRPRLAAAWSEWREEKARRAAVDRGHGIASAAVFAALRRHVPADAAIALDVGNNAYSFGRYFECEREPVLLSGYLGSIGFGYPAAMGAWAAAPERTIVAVTGDGGFGQYLAELCTAVQYGMPIKHVLLANAELGKIRVEQNVEGLPAYKTALHNPSFSAYAKLCGAHGERVTDPAELDGALERAFAHEGPALVEVITDTELV